MSRTSFLASLLFVVGCGTPEPAPGPDAELCEHLKEGPSVAVTATAATAAAPSVSMAHTRYDITLVDVTGGKGGSVKFESGHELETTIALSEDVPVKVFDNTGLPVAFEESATSSKDCAEVKGRHVFPLRVGAYTLTFGPTAATSVQAVIETAPHGH